MKLDNNITTLYILEAGNFTRRSHVDITSNFIDEINKELNLESDNEDGIEITIDHIKEAMVQSNGIYPLIVLKDHYDGEFELHSFIFDYMYDSIYSGTIDQVNDSIEEDISYTEWSEN